MSLDLLSIGDASLDVFLTPSESESFCRIDNKECFISFTYGDKIPVKRMEITVGGNAANNAVGTKRLGINSALVTTMGEDMVGQQILSIIESEGVDTSFVITQPASFSNYSTIINYAGERTILSYKAPISYRFPVKLPNVSWVYLTSMGDSFRPFFNHLIDWLKVNPQIKLAFNPGSRQLRVDFNQIADVVSRSYILYVNREEAEKITGFGNSQGKEKELLKKVTELGVKIPIITDGNNGSFVFDGEKYLRCGVLPVDAYERTGAGDAFGSGCLSALIKGKPFEEALLWGTVNAASVIGYTGSQRGLLREDEIEIWLERARSSGVKVEEI
ncbi:MAG: sugar kinase [Patescibacteria group bacterium]|nr:MAG: sugar kinase [Patescibacteria group bacterium]